MKKYVVLTSILALAACGGGGGGHSGATSSEHYSTPSAIRSANSKVTQMETFTSNADEIVATVRAAGIDLGSSGSTARFATHRGASAATLDNAFASTATNAQKRAMAELKNMYDIATDDAVFAAASEQELRNAFVLAGNNASDFNAENRDAARTAIISRYATVLDSLVAKDSTEYLWRPQISTLDDVQFKIGSEDSYIRFELDDSGKIVALGKYDYDHDQDDYVLSEEGRFVRSGDGNTFAANIYTWSFQLEQNGTIDGAYEHFYDPVEVSDNDQDLAVADIKTKLIAKITEKINKVKESQNPSNPNYATDMANLDTALAEYTTQVNNATGFGTPAESSASLQIESVKNGLKYADLGFAYLKLTDGVHTDTMFSPYVGGYDSRAVDTFTENVTFKGTAVAGIDHKENHPGSENDVQDGMLVRDNNATLTMNTDGKAQLVMNNLVGVDAAHKGYKWYDVTIDTDTTTAHGTPKVTISNASGKDIAQDFAMATVGNTPLEVQFAAGNWRDLDEQYVISGDPDADGKSTRYGAMSEVNAYGPTANNPTEATSRFGFSEEQHWNDNADKREVAIYGVFGGKK